PSVSRRPSSCTTPRSTPRRRTPSSSGTAGRRGGEPASRWGRRPVDSTGPALVAQWTEHLTTDQKVGGSSPSERASDQRKCCLAMMSRVPSTAVDGNRLAVRVQEGLHPVGDDAILPPEP